MRPWNYIGAVLVSVWLYLLFLLIVGFGYSYFWTASSIIYLLMRHKVDDTDFDEVHLEEEPTEEPFGKQQQVPPHKQLQNQPFPAMSPWWRRRRCGRRRLQPSHRESRH